MKPMRTPLLLPALLLLAAHARAEGLADQLKWNFQARTRAESRNNTFDFNSAKNSVTDDTFVLARVRLGVEWQPDEWVRIALQGQDTREAFSKRVNVPLQNGAEGDDTFDLRLASIELGNPKHFSVKAGRQVLSYGDERLVGPLEWQNFSRTFDAVKLHYQTPTWWLDAFTSSVVRIRRSQFNVSDWIDDGSTRNQFFSGLYFSSQAIPFQTTDLYAFHLHEENNTGVSNFVTFGTRHKGDPTKLRGWDYTVELVGQVGQLSGKSLTAYAYHLEGGYNWLKTPWKPRLALEYSAGSGDSNPNDGHAHTFQNLFPTNHPPYGFMDLFSWQNMQNVALRLAANPTAKTKTTLDFHSFWLTTTGDAWYRANGTTNVRPISPNANSHAGCELDLTVSTKLTPHLDLLLGYSHFFAGAYLAATGPSDDADFGYCMLTLNY